MEEIINYCPVLGIHNLIAAKNLHYFWFPDKNGESGSKYERLKNIFCIILEVL